MSNKAILLITGANTGLGLETVNSLCRSSKAYTILLGGRSLEKATAAAKAAREEYPDTASTIEPIQVDIEDDTSISNAFETVSNKYGHLDVLINNAGTQLDQQVAKGTMTLREVWDKSWSVNTTSTQIFTHVFAPLLIQSSSPRLIFIASGTSTLTEHSNPALPVNRSPPSGWPKPTYMLAAYRSAKCGMNMMMREWFRILGEDGVKVWAVSPGMLATGLGGDKEALKKAGAIEPSVGADFVRAVVEGARDQDVGRVIRKDNVQPW